MEKEHQSVKTRLGVKIIEKIFVNSNNICTFTKVNSINKNKLTEIMKTINPFEIVKEKSITSSNADHELVLFWSDASNKFHVVFNALSIDTYKTKVGAVKLANKFINKYDLS
jgi:hypothetical protein